MVRYCSVFLALQRDNELNAVEFRIYSKVTAPKKSHFGVIEYSTEFPHVNFTRFTLETPAKYIQNFDKITEV